MHRDDGGRRAAVDRTWLVTILVVACVTVLRSWNAFAFPVLVADDGVRLAACFQLGVVDGLTWTHSGYVALLPNVLTTLGSVAPFGWQPALYAAMSAAVASVALSLFASRRFRVVLADDRMRMVVCITMALAPHGNARLVSGAMWTQYQFAWMSVLLALVAPPRGGGRRWLEGIFAVALTWTSPVALASAPLRLVALVRSRRDRAFHAVQLAAACAYVLCARTGGSAASNGLLEMAWAFVRLVGRRVVAETAIGGAWQWLGASVWALSALLLVWLVRETARLPLRSRRHVVALATAIAAVLVMTVVGRPHMGMPDTFWGHRYTYVPRLCLHLAAMVVLAARAAATPRGRSLFATCTIGYAALLAVVGSELYETSRREGEAVQQWALETEDWLHGRGTAEAPPRLRRPGDWDLALPAPTAALPDANAGAPPPTAPR